jgi:Fe-S oxidoreductase
MIDRLKEEVETAQTRLREASDRWTNERKDLVRNARHQVHKVREEGSERLWKFERQALAWADEVLERAEDLPGVARVTDPIERLVNQARDAVNANPIPEYDGLNARTAADAVRTLDRVGLAKVARYEAANKNRKTVFQAIERRKGQLDKPPFADA